MANIASGVNKTVAYSKEASWGVKPTAGTATYLRRVSCDINLSREQFSSAEITTTAQTSSSRSGTDNVEGTLSGEASAKSYDDFYAALLRGPWVAGTVLGALTTVSASAVDNSFNRVAGSWITDGLRVGDTVTVTGWTAPATANNKTYTVVSLTALKVIVDMPVVTKLAGDSVVVSVAGKKLVVPITVAGRTDDSFTIEETLSDIGSSFLYTGVKVSSANLSIGPDAMVGVEFGLMGKDGVESGTAYFTTPAAASTVSNLASNAGAIFVSGAQVGTITDYSIEITGNMEAGKVVFNELPDGTRPAAGIFLGRIGCTGSLTAYVTDSVLFNKARNEEAVTVVLRADGDDNTSMTFKFPKTKLSIPQRTDTETGGLQQSMDFTALLPDGTDLAVEQSSVVIQSVYP